MNLNTHKEFVEIAKSDFPGFSGRMPLENQLRSFEHYLNKNNRENSFDGKIFIIYVTDKADAIKIGRHLNLSHIKYWNGFVYESLNLKGERCRGRPKNTVTDLVSGKGMTVNQFIKHTREITNEQYLTKSEIVKRKILKRGELEKFIKTGKLREEKIGSKDYINRGELTKVI